MPNSGAERRKISVNKLIDELSTATLAEFDTETRFRARAALASPEEALRLLEYLDRRDARWLPAQTEVWEGTGSLEGKMPSRRSRPWPLIASFFYFAALRASRAGRRFVDSASPLVYSH